MSRMSYVVSRKPGFTLVELLVFSGIFVLIMVAFITIFITVTRIGTRQSAAAEVNQQSNFLIRQIQYYVEQSSLVELDQDQATSTLKLRMAASSTDPTYIYLSSSTAYLRQTDAGTAFPLTSSRVNVTALTFTKRSNAPSRDIVDVRFTVANNTQNIQQQFSQSVNTSIARRGAAVFDSNVLPSSTATHHLGVATHTWNSVNETIYLAGSNVGVGTQYPTQALEIDGGLRISTSSATSTCNASRRGTLWATQGSSTGGSANISLVQKKQNWSVSGPSQLTVNVSSTGAGNALIVVVGMDKGTPGTVTGVGDAQGDRFVSAGARATTGSNRSTEIWYATSTVGATTAVSTTISVIADGLHVWVYEVSGLDPTNMLDATGTITGTSQNPTGPQLATSTQADEFFVGNVQFGNDITGMLNSWTNATIQNGNSAAHLIASAVTSTAPRWSGNSSGNYVSSAASFRGLSSGGTKDAVVVCAKDASDAYSWRTIY